MNLLFIVFLFVCFAFRGCIKRLPDLSAVLLKAADKASGQRNPQVPEDPES